MSKIQKIILVCLGLVLLFAALKLFVTFNDTRKQKLTQLGENILQVGGHQARSQDWKVFKAGAFSIMWPLTATSDPDTALQALQQYSAEKPGVYRSIDFFNLINDSLAIQGAFNIFNFKTSEPAGNTELLATMNDVASQLGDGKPMITSAPLKVSGFEESSKATAKMDGRSFTIYGFTGKVGSSLYTFILMDMKSSLSSADFTKIIDSIKINQ